MTKLREWKLSDYLQYWFWKVFFTFFPEWTENWKSWPHCNGQAGCWMHTSASWCKCRCGWCRIARLVRSE